MNKFLLISLICILLIVFVFNNTESFANTCTLVNTDLKKEIIKQNSELIKENDLTPYLDILLNPLINQQVFNDKITVQQYLTENKVPENKIKLLIEFYQTILTDNIMISGLVEYELNDKTLMKDIVNTFQVDNLRNSLVCLVPDKKVLDMLVQQMYLLLIIPKVELCSKEKFIEYCDKNYSAQIQSSKVEPKVKVVSEKKPSGETKIKAEVINKQEIEQFATEIDEAKKQLQTGAMKILEIESNLLPLINNNPKFMDTKSITEVLSSFNEKSFGTDVEKQLKILLERYQSKYGRKVNLINRKEFNNLVFMLIDEIKLIIQRLVDEDDLEKLKVIIGDFNSYKKIFYLFKHNYKIMQAYEIINKEVSDNDEKLKALLCCSKKGSESCHNFSNIAKNPKSIIFGFNKFGYANSLKCIKDSEEAKILINEQSKVLGEILSTKYEMWKLISKENKEIIMNNFIKLLRANDINISNLSNKLGDLRQEIGSQKKVDVSHIFRTLTIKPHDISKFFKLGKEAQLKIVEIEQLDKVSKVQDMVKTSGFDKDQIIFNPNVKLEYAKKITSTLIIGREILGNFNYKNNVDTVAKLFGIVGVHQSFEEIMKETTIKPKYHSVIVEYIMKIIELGQYAVINKWTMSSIPDEVIKYLQSKPTDINLNLCSIRGEFLQKLRKDRVIDLKEFDDYQNQLQLYCNPSQVPIKDIKSNKIPIDEKSGLHVVEREHKHYGDFIKEHKEIEEQNLKTEVVSDNILYNLMKNTYN